MSKFAIGLLTLAMYAASLPVIAMITPAKAASSSSKHIMHKKHRGPGFSDPGFVGQARPVPRPSSEAVSALETPEHRLPSVASSNQGRS